MIVMVCLSAYCLIDLAVSAFVSILWRTRAVAPATLPPHVRARRIMLLRITPCAMAIAITALVVAPAFALFEPGREGEPFGPTLALLAAFAAANLLAAFTRALNSLWVTKRVEREWLRGSIALPGALDPCAFVINAASPVVALVGVFAPKLIAAQRVVDACTPAEVAAIVAHERGHFMARDNLKRWLMASLPDTLRWTPMHRDIIDAWHHAAEDAADDAATNGDAEARADLAALLLKVVRLAPHPIWHAAVVSPFVERDGLERRVRRLIKPELEPPAPLAIAPMVAAATIVVAVIVTLSSPSTLESVFEMFERLVALGR